MIGIVREEIDVAAVLEAAKRPEIGALVTFLGTVRDDGIERMDLEAYEEVAVQEFAAIREEAIEKWPITSVDILHRVGSLAVGENILLIVVGAGHRKEAFDACEYVLERIKESVPIWKKEVREDGETWVPGEYPEGPA